MSIRLFNIDFSQTGSALCALTTLLLIGVALVALLEFGEYAISQLISLF